MPKSTHDYDDVWHIHLDMDCDETSLFKKYFLVIVAVNCYFNNITIL